MPERGFQPLLRRAGTHEFFVFIPSLMLTNSSFPLGFSLRGPQLPDCHHDQGLVPLRRLYAYRARNRTTAHANLVQGVSFPKKVTANFQSSIRIFSSRALPCDRNRREQRNGIDRPGGRKLTQPGRPISANSELHTLDRKRGILRISLMHRPL
jgi:hypothetical protein